MRDIEEIVQPSDNPNVLQVRYRAGNLRVFERGVDPDFETIAKGGHGAIRKLDPLPAFHTANDAKSAVTAWLEDLLRPILSDATEAERMSWPVKEHAARAYISESASEFDIATLSPEAALTGESLDELSRRIIAKADTYRKLAAGMTGLRRRAYSAINAEIDPLRYSEIVSAMKVGAVAIIADSGLSELTIPD